MSDVAVIALSCIALIGVLAMCDAVVEVTRIRSKRRPKAGGE